MQYEKQTRKIKISREKLLLKQNIIKKTSEVISYILFKAYEKSIWCKNNKKVKSIDGGIQRVMNYAIE